MSEYVVSLFFFSLGHLKLCRYFLPLHFMSDSSWGVSQFLTGPRGQAAKFTLKYYEYDPSRLQAPSRLSQITAYDRCKANRRCNWGIVGNCYSKYA